jgi:hypothetical protein
MEGGPDRKIEGGSDREIEGRPDRKIEGGSDRKIKERDPAMDAISGWRTASDGGREREVNGSRDERQGALGSAQRGQRRAVEGKKE